MSRQTPARSEIEMDYPLLVSSHDSDARASSAGVSDSEFEAIQASGGTFAALPGMQQEGLAAAREAMDRRMAEDLARQEAEGAGVHVVPVGDPAGGDMVFSASRGGSFFSSPGFRRAAIGVLIGSLALLLIVIILSRTWKNDDGNGGGNNPPITVDRSRKVLVVALDGVRGTAMSAALMQNKAPHLLEMANAGAFANCTDIHSPFCAYAHSGARYSEFPFDPATGPVNQSYQWVTAPGWASTFTGLDNSRHKVKSVEPEDQRIFYNITRRYPTLMKRIKATGRKTCAAGLPNFLSRAEFTENSTTYGASYGILDFECWPTETLIVPDTLQSCNLDRRLGNRYWFNNSADSKSVEFVKQCIGDSQSGNSDLVVVHLDTVDETGHNDSSAFSDTDPLYLNAITWVDSQIKELIDQIDAAGTVRTEKWLVLVTSDHGGHGNGHKIQLFDDEVIPFFVAVRANGKWDPTAVQPLTYPVRHMDVTPTALAWFMQKTSNLGLDGRVQGIQEFN